jgi:hypothetical protein
LVNAADRRRWRLESLLENRGAGGPARALSTIIEHLKNIFETGEFDEKVVCRDF